MLVATERGSEYWGGGAFRMSSGCVPVAYLHTYLHYSARARASAIYIHTYKLLLLYNPFTIYYKTPKTLLFNYPNNSAIALLALAGGLLMGILPLRRDSATNTKTTYICPARRQEIAPRSTTTQPLRRAPPAACRSHSRPCPYDRL